MEMSGDIRVDNCFCLRDESRSNSEMLPYIKEENEYFDSVMSWTKKIEDEIFAELRGRKKEDDISVPLRRRSYYYYYRTLKGEEYVLRCRRLIPNSETPPPVIDVMETGPNAPPEHVILDENAKAKAHAYYGIGAYKVSPNGKLVSYAEDTKGDEIYTVFVIDIETGAPVEKPVVGVTGYIQWAGDEAFVHITRDEIHQPH